MSLPVPEAERIALYSIAAVGTLATIRDLSTGRGPQVRVALGVAVAGVGLTSLAQGAPDLAASLSLLVLISAVVVMGAEVFADITNGLNGGSSGGSSVPPLDPGTQRLFLPPALTPNAPGVPAPILAPPSTPSDPNGLGGYLNGLTH